MGNPHKPSFATLTAWGVDLRYKRYNPLEIHRGYSKGWFAKSYLLSNIAIMGMLQLKE